jgi:vacuolar-type H+-ATPase subunit E/Vma4
VKTIETLKSELETLKSTPVNSAELEQLRQINAQYEQELALSRVESTRAFQENVHAPMVNVVEYLESLASKYELSSRDMLGAFAESDPAKQSDLIADLAASMNERDRLRFYSSADDYAEIISRRDYYQANSREWKAQLEAQHQAELAQHTAQSEQQVSAQRAEYEQAVEKVFDSLKESVPVLNDDEVAVDVQRLAKGDYSGADPELKAYMAHSGALLPHLLKALKAAQSELEDANKKIVGYRNGSPKAGSGSAETSRSLPDDIGFLEALDQQLG